VFSKNSVVVVASLNSMVVLKKIDIDVHCSIAVHVHCALHISFHSKFIILQQLIYGHHNSKYSFRLGYVNWCLSIRLCCLSVW